MPKSFVFGDRVYIILNGVLMAELTIISASRLYFIRRYMQTRGGTRLAVHRKYASREKTQVVLDEKKKNANIRRPYLLMI